MMLTKPKPDNVRESSPSPTILTTNTNPVKETTDDREKELERRLAMLGTGDVEETPVEIPVETTVETTVEEDSLLSFDAAPVAVAPPPPVKVELKPEPVVAAPKPKPAAVKPNKSALLARIMAAQERAKQAQMKQAAATTTTTTTAPPVQHQLQPTTVLPPPAQVTIDAEQEKEKMMKALSGIVDVEIEKETKDNDFKPPSLPPPQFMPPPTSAPPPMAMMAPPLAPPPPMTAMAPPSFEIFEQQQMRQQKPVAPPPPPAFDTIENEILGFPDVQAPSAPPPEDTILDNFDGITPMAPPPTYPGEQAEVEPDVFEYDMDGNKLSPEERRNMMEEQRAIMEQIQKQAVENKASEAAVRANAFETRMTGNQPVSAPTRTTESSSLSTAVDFTTVDPAEIEEQRRILEEIQKTAKKAKGSVAGDYQSPAVASSRSESTAQRTVDLGDGKRVALHGQDKTKEAIKDGTSVLVQCANCENWMQVTGAASLMFCPICNVVSPVLTQDAVQSSEAAQMEEDRKLAEQLQNEENESASEYPANRRRAAASAAPQESSWWDSMMVSIGVSNAPEDSDEKRSAEINVNRPPGSRGMSASQRALHSDDYETEGLLGSGGSDPRAARVAESKPLFSCVVDSVSHAATAAAAGVTSMTYGDDDEEVHGIDTTSFLAVPNVGDDRGPSGNYSAIANDN